MVSAALDAHHTLLAAAKALNPILPAERAHYLTPPDGGIQAWITKALARDSTSQLLAIGGIGSGMTTELLRAQEVIEERKLARAWHVPLDAYFDLGNLGKGRLVTLAGLAILSVLRERKVLPADLHEAAVALHEMLRSDREVTAPLAVKGYTKPHRAPAPPIAAADLAGRIDALVRRWREGQSERDKRTAPEGIVLLVDALDRKSFHDFLLATSADLPILRTFGVGVVIIGNMEWRHDLTVDRSEVFDEVRVQASFDPSKQRDASFLHEVLMRRVPDLFVPEVADAVVAASGGVLRDLLRLARGSVNEAIDRGATSVANEDFALAVDVFREGRLARLEEQDRNVLTKLMNGAVLDSGEGDRLLERGCVILRDGAFEPHPSLRIPAQRPEAA